jgi:alpha-glucosidase
MKIANKYKGMNKIKEGYVITTDDFNFKIIFITDDIIRIRASTEKDFPEASYVLTTTAWDDRFDDYLNQERRKIKPLEVKYDETEKELIFNTARLKLVLVKEPVAFKILNLDGEEIYSDLNGRSYVQNEKGQIFHYSKIDEYNDYFYGFGEQTGKLNKRYERITLNPKDAYMYDAEKTNPLYKHIPFYIRLNKKSKQAFGIFYHNTYEAEFNLAQERNNYYDRYSYYKAEGGDLDWFFINGPKVSSVIERYTDLTGKTVLPPLFALGYIGSAMYYVELEKNCDDEIIGFIEKNREEGIPIDCFHLSSGYTVGKDGKRYVFTWNNVRFRDPEGFIKKMENYGVPVSPNIKPGILTSHPYYTEFEESNALIKSRGGSSYTDYWWGGIGSFIDFSSKSGRKIWKQKMIEELLNYGIKSIWNDNCEFEIGDDTAICDFDGVPTEAKAIKSVLPNLMAKVAYDTLLEQYPETRPFVVNRSGFSGIQRYASTWAGDNYTEWKTIKFNIATILGMGLSGVAHNGCDVGGFGGPHPEKELFVRWVQNGIFMPRFSIHSSNNDNTVTEPWMYPSVKKYIKEAILLRYSFIPYFYSLMYEASTKGSPILRPLFYEFQNDENTYAESFHFMFGKFILVANVFAKGEKKKSIYLPEGADWYDWQTRERYAGGTTIQYDVNLGTIPMFIRTGAIIPRTNQLKDLHKDVANRIDIIIQPNEDSSFIFYEDDGKSNDNLQGIYLENKITVKSGDCVKVSFEKEGMYKSPIETIVFDVINEQKSAYWVKIDGSRIRQFLDYQKWDRCNEGWYYDAEKKATLIKIKNIPDDFEMNISFEPFDLLGM